MPRRITLLAAALLALAAMVLTASPVRAHDVTYELRGAGDARIAFRYQDGSPMADAAVAIFAPGSRMLPDTTGRTDAAGQVYLNAGRDGIWRIEVHDELGHASRARVRVQGGVVSLAAQTIPDWLVATSLLGNVILAGLLGFIRRNRRSRNPGVHPAAAVPRGHLPTC